MANVPYGSGVSEVSPDARPPDDYQRIETNPGMFGGAVASGLQKAGEGALSAGNFWGEVQTDGVLNDSMKQLNDLAERAKSLQGQEALDAQDAIKKQASEIVDTGRGQLKTPDQQHRYDSTIRPFADRYIAGQLTTHFVTQGRVHATNVNTDAFTLALNNVASAADNPDEVAKFKEDARQARVRQVQLEGNGGDPTAVKSAITAADQAVVKSQVEAIRVKDPVRAQQLIEQNKTLLGTDYAPLAERVKAQAEVIKDQTKTNGFIDSTRPGAPPAFTLPKNSYLGHDSQGNPVAIDSSTGVVMPVQPAAKPQASSGAEPPAAPAQPQRGKLAPDDAAGMIRHFEAFSPTPYWDVNHWRVGYGSDTITRADGTVVPVTAMTQVTREDAERDLARRTQLSQSDVQRNIGADAWDRLSGPAKASLTSLSYNYGTLAKIPSVVAAARSGDQNALAQAVANQSGANGGVNAHRRSLEAGNILGTAAIPAGVYASAANRRMVLPEIASMAGGGPAQAAGVAAQIVQQPVDHTPETWGVTNAALMNPDPAAMPVAPPPPPADPQAHEAAAIGAAMSDPDLAKDPVAQKRVVAQIKFQFAQAAIAAEATKSARKELSERTASDYVTQFAKGGLTPQMYHGILADTNLDVETRLTLGEKLRKLSGQTDTASYGPNWADVRRRIMLPPEDPSHMTFQDALGADGVTTEGLKEIVATQKRNREGLGGALVTKMTNQALKYAGDQMKLEMGFGDNIKIPNLGGQRVFDGTVAPYIIQHVDEMASRGDQKAIDDFLKPENIDKVVNQFYSRRQLTADTNFVAGNTNAAKNPGQQEPMPPAPQGVDAKAWAEVVSAVPLRATGQPWKFSDWAGAVNTLLADPSPEMRQAFDKAMDQAGGLSSAAVLQKFGVNPSVSAAPQPRSVSLNEALGGPPTASPVSSVPAEPPTASPAPPPGAFYGNEPAPSEKDAEDYARAKADRTAAQLATGAERMSGVAAAAKPIGEVDPDLRLRASLDSQVTDAESRIASYRERLSALEARSKAGGRVGTEKAQVEKDLAAAEAEHGKLRDQLAAVKKRLEK